MSKTTKINARTIDLSSNKLNKFSYYVFENTVLKNLILSNNNISKLNVLALQLSLETLYLDNNNIVGLNGTTFDKIRQINKLILKDNKINSLESRPFSRITLTELDLENNNISRINLNSFLNANDLLQGEYKLRIINLRKNPIKLIDKNLIASALFGNLDKFYVDNYVIIVNYSIKTLFYNLRYFF